MADMDESTINKLDKAVRQFVLPVLRIGVGTGFERVQICDVFSGTRSSDSEPHGDRFNCLVPYCGSMLSWQIIFDATRPRSCPDVIVDGGEGDNNGFRPELKELPSLWQWDASDSLSLLKVLNELLDSYRAHCRQLLARHFPCIAAQVEMLFSSNTVPGFDVLPFVVAADPTTTADKTAIVVVVVRLPLDLSLLPAYLLPVNPGPSRGNLQLTFCAPEENPYVGARLDLSVPLQRVFQGVAGFTLPSWGSDGVACLLDYVCHVRQLLLDKLELICESFARRRDFILAFCNLYGKGLVEFDSESFKRISFIIISPISPASHALHFMVYVDLSNQFPGVCPKFTIQSVYHRTANGGPATRVFDKDYPYSPRWPGHEMAERSRVFLMEKSLQFAQDLMPGNARDPGWPVVC